MHIVTHMQWHASLFWRPQTHLTSTTYTQTGVKISTRTHIHVLSLSLSLSLSIYLSITHIYTRCLLSISRRLPTSRLFEVYFVVVVFIISWVVWHVLSLLRATSRLPRYRQTHPFIISTTLPCSHPLPLFYNQLFCFFACLFYVCVCFLPFCVFCFCFCLFFFVLLFFLFFWPSLCSLGFFFFFFCAEGTEEVVGMMGMVGSWNGEISDEWHMWIDCRHWKRYKFVCTSWLPTPRDVDSATRSILHFISPQPPA